MGFFDDAISSIGKSLATSATSYLTETTGYDVGGTMAFLFGGDQTTKGETLDGLTANLSNEFTGNADSLALLQNSLNDQADQIRLLGDQLTAMSTAIQDIDGEIKGIEGLLEEISQRQLYLTWQAQDDEIKNYIVRIDSAFQTYALYVAQDAEASDVADLADSILDPNDGELDAANAINGFMLTDQQNKGALQLWAEMTCPLIEAGLLDYRQAVDQYFAYYTKLAWAQLRATNLVMEAYHFHGSEDDELAAAAWTSYQALILSQETEFIGNLISIVRSGISGSVDYYYYYPAYHAVTQFHPDFTGVYDAKNYKYLGTYYEPSSVLMRGEELLARLAITDPDDRRIVVHMMYLGEEFKTPVETAPITLSMISEDSGGVVQPDSAPAVYGPMAVPDLVSKWVFFGDLDPEWIAGNDFYVTRFVYSGSTENPLGDGLYQLTNMNGVGPLVPLQTYWGMTPFQSKPVLGYTMQIHAAQPFDYMNFAAYFTNGQETVE